MQREIKFRVFDKEAKTMHQVSSIDFENKEVFIYDKNGFDKGFSTDHGILVSVKHRRDCEEPYLKDYTISYLELLDFVYKSSKK